MSASCPSIPSARPMVRAPSSSATPRPMLNQPSALPSVSTVLIELGPVSMIFGSPLEREMFDSVESIVMAVLRGSRLQDDLDAAVLLVAEDLVHFRPVLEGGGMRDDEGGIDLSLFDAAKQIVRPAIHMGLAAAHGQALVHQHAHRDLVVEAGIDAGDGEDSGRPADIDHLAQDMRPIILDADHLLGSIEDRVRLPGGDM